MTFEEALKKAIEKEEMAYEFYMGLLEYVTDLSAKEMIKELAEEELKHKEAVERVLESGDLDELGRDRVCYLVDLGIANVVPPKVVKKDLSLQEVLQIAMKHEENSKVYYEKLAEEFKGKEAERVFKRLAEEEECHRNNVQKIYDELILTEN